MSFAHPITHTDKRFIARHAVAAALAVLFTAGTQATPTPTQLKAIKVYGDVTLDEDSVSDWGPWTEFEAPAAGAPLGFLGLPSARPEYRPPVIVEPPLEPESVGCAAGGICGFGVFSETATVDFGREQPKELSDTLPAELPYLMTGAVVEGPAGEGVLPQVINLTTQALAGGTVMAPASGDLSLDIDPTTFGSFHYGDQITYARSLITESGEDTYRIGNWLSNEQQADAAAAGVSWVMGGPSLLSYISGDNGVTVTQTSQGMYGILGLATSAADLALQGGTATYSGESRNGIFGSVNLTVNFSNGTWSGTWNGGADQNVFVASSSIGPVIYGQIGFQASGTISGVNLNSTSITANDGTIGAGSIVKGAFFGSNAAAVGGVASIVKTTEAYTDARGSGVFLTTRNVAKVE